MKLILNLVLAVLGLCTSCSDQRVLNPKQFTKDYAEILRTSHKELRVEIAGEMELKVIFKDGRDFTMFLNNGYDLYKQEPKHKNEVIQRFITAGLESQAALSAPVQRTKIVPVVKDRAWMEETRKAMLARGAKEPPMQVFEELNPELVILYAEDSPKNIRYLTPKDLEGLKLEQKDLRELACENLRRILPKIEKTGGSGVYMMTAGGDYEASLLLLDSIWKTSDLKIKGEIVVAIPTRGLLFVTGSEDTTGIQKVREIIKKALKEGAYQLTPKLFVYREGKFIEFKK